MKLGDKILYYYSYISGLLVVIFGLITLLFLNNEVIRYIFLAIIGNFILVIITNLILFIIALWKS